MNQIECPHGCGRKFIDDIKLEEHINRRHVLNQLPQMTSLYENLKQNNQKRILRPKLAKIADQVQVKYKLTTLPPKSILRPKLTQSELVEKPEKPEKSEKLVRIVQPEIQVSSNTLIESKKLITRQLIYKNSDTSELGEVTHLSLKSQNLLIFESTLEVPFEEFKALKCLSLSQNRLINVIGVGMLHNLVELNLNNNQIQTLQPLSNCKMLQKLYCSYNRINCIDLGLMIHLKYFHIGNNSVSQFDEIEQSIKQMPSLKDLEIQDNPCTQNYKYKNDILWITYIERLDHQTLTQQDYNLAQQHRQSNVINNRPVTAPQQVEMQNNDENYDDQNYLEEELDELYQINSELKEKVDKLERQNIELRTISERVPSLEEQMQEMQKRINCYETIVQLKDTPENELRQYIFKLQQQIESLKQFNSQDEDVDVDQMHKMNENNLKFQTTQTTILKQLESENSESDDDRFFRDDEQLSQQPSQEMMDLIMRNSMTLSKLKDEFKEM